jgi:hypothetical protein
MCTLVARHCRQDLILRAAHRSPNAWLPRYMYYDMLTTCIMIAAMQLEVR